MVVVSATPSLLTLKLASLPSASAPVKVSLVSCRSQLYRNAFVSPERFRQARSFVLRKLVLFCEHCIKIDRASALVCLNIYVESRYEKFMSVYSLGMNYNTHQLGE